MSAPEKLSADSRSTASASVDFDPRLSQVDLDGLSIRGSLPFTTTSSEKTVQPNVSISDLEDLSDYENVELGDSSVFEGDSSGKPKCHYSMHRN